MNKKEKGNELFILGVIGLVFAIVIVGVLILTVGKDKGIKVSFDPQNGTKITAIEVDKEGKIKLPEVKRDGYTFLGWFLDNEKVDDNHKYTKSVTLTAKWEGITYTISFNTDGGSTVSSIKAGYSEKVTLPTGATKTGYKFRNWVDKNGSIYSGEIIVTSDLELTAKWEEDTPIVTATPTPKPTQTETPVPVVTGRGKLVTLVFRTNSGNNINPRKVQCNVPAVLPTPTRAGYVFDGWVDANGNKVANRHVFSCNETVVTLTAEWQSSARLTPTPTPNVAATPSTSKSSYTITFDSNGGREIKDVITVKCGESIPELPKASKDGYIFTVWRNRANGQAISKGLKLTTCEDIIVEAYWITMPTTPNGR